MLGSIRVKSLSRLYISLSLLRLQLIHISEVSDTGKIPRCRRPLIKGAIPISFGSAPLDQGGS